MKWSVVFAALFAVGLAENDDFEKSWNSFKGKLGTKLFNPLKEGIYKKNYFEATKDIEETNALYRKGQSSYKKQLGPYSHLPHDEFLALRTGLIPSPEPKVPEKWVRKGLKGTTPAGIDWSTSHSTPIKDQGTCGSCYSFAVTAVAESQLIKNHKKKIDLSNQQIIDCTGSYGNKGCKGGYTHKTMGYVKDNKGLPAFSSYPYTGRQGTCPKATFPPLADIVKSYKRLTYVPKEQLKEIVATTGPVVISIKVLKSFKDYKGGIYREPACGPKTLISDVNHAVVLVGYGVANGTPYWKVRNSWGTNWGVGGYVHMAQDFDCGVTTDVVVPNC